MRVGILFLTFYPSSSVPPVRPTAAVHPSERATMTRLRTLAVFSALLCFGPTGYSQLVINPTFDSSITSDPNSAQIQTTINQAIGFYKTNFTDNLTVNITFKIDETITLGMSSFFTNTVPYDQFRTALTSHATTANDALALASLPTGISNPVNGNSSMTLSTPNLRALGFSGNPPSGQPDGTVSLKMSIMNLQHGVITDPAKFDLFAVASHEINEVLGLGSNLNSPSPLTSAPRPMDLWRYDQTGTGTRSYTQSGSAQSFFSLNGTTQIVRFNQDGTGDYGDWFSPLGHMPQRVQDAFATAGVSVDMSTAEVTALDVIGFTPVPEPAVTFGAVAAVAAWVGVRRRARPVV
jgi:hypothetical protein